MRTVLVTGFPGSGKTTLLLSLVDYLKDRMCPDAVVIVETESGDAKTDEALFASPFPVKDLTLGCICCTTMSQSLLSVLDEIHSSPFPLLVLVETSSISHKTIKSVIEDSFPGDDPPLSVLVVDPEAWESQLEDSTLLATSMAQLADLILLSPKDPASSGFDELSRGLGLLSSSPVGAAPTPGARSDDLFAVLDCLGLSGKGGFCKRAEPYDDGPRFFTGL